ncbi:MAG: LysE family translocator [Gammaproteobacteria bacterium]
MTDAELLYAAAAVLFVASFTPGPNNAICCALAANGGFWRAFPWSLGVMSGFPLLMGFAGFGLGGLFDRIPELHLVVKTGGALFLLYLAWKIAHTAPPNKNGENKTRKENKRDKRSGIALFAEALLFQWINPKAIAVTISTTAAYARPGEHLTGDVLALMIMSSLFALGSTTIWTLIGAAISRYLTSPKAHKVFNCLMALLLTAAIPPIFFV